MPKQSGKNLLFIINQQAGLLNTSHSSGEAEEMCRKQFPFADFVETPDEKHAIKALHAAASLKIPPRIVLIGGDGTVHLAAECLAGKKVETALIPAGTANNIARSLGIPEDTTAALSLAASGAARPIDAGLCSGKLFLEAAGTGFHATALARYSLRNRKSLVRAIYAFARTAADMPPVEALITADGRTLRRTFHQLTISNLPMYGTNFRMAPAAKPDDGFLNATIVPRLKPHEIPALAIAARAGFVHLLPGVETFRFKVLHIKTSVALPVHTDAMTATVINPEFKVFPAALAIVRK